MYICLSASAFEIFLETFGGQPAAVRALKMAVKKAAEAAGFTEPKPQICLPYEVVHAECDVRIYLPMKGPPFCIMRLTDEKPEEAVAALAVEALRDPRASDALFLDLQAEIGRHNSKECISTALKVGDPLWLLDCVEHLLNRRDLVEVTSAALARGPIELDLATKLAQKCGAIGDLLAASPSHALRDVAAKSTKNLSPRAQGALAVDLIGAVRLTLAGRKDISKAVLNHLAVDRSLEVREAVYENMTWRGDKLHERDFCRGLRRRRLALIDELERLGKGIADLFEPGVLHEEWAIATLALVISRLPPSARPEHLFYAEREAGMWLRAARPFTNMCNLLEALAALEPLADLAPEELVKELAVVGHERRDRLWPEFQYLRLADRFPRLASLQRRPLVFDYEFEVPIVAADVWIVGIQLDNDFQRMTRCLASRRQAEAPLILRRRGRPIAILGVDAMGMIRWQAPRIGRKLAARELALVQRLLNSELGMRYE